MLGEAPHRRPEENLRAISNIPLETTNWEGETEDDSISSCPAKAGEVFHEAYAYVQVSCGLAERTKRNQFSPVTNNTHLNKQSYNLNFKVEPIMLHVKEITIVLKISGENKVLIGKNANKILSGDPSSYFFKEYSMKKPSQGIPSEFKFCLFNGADSEERVRVTGMISAPPALDSRLFFQHDFIFHLNKEWLNLPTENTFPKFPVHLFLGVSFFIFRQK